MLNSLMLSAQQKDLNEMKNVLILEKKLFWLVVSCGIITVYKAMTYNSSTQFSITLR